MQGIYFELPVVIGCCCCDAEERSIWKAPLSAVCSRRGVDGREARASIVRAAQEAGWLVRGTAALCPECLKAAMHGDVSFIRPDSALEATDQVMLTFAVRKMRRRADAE